MAKNAGRHQQAKNQREREAYGRSIRKNNRMNPTDTYGAETLRGSDDPSYYENENNLEDSAPNIGKMSIATWIRRNKMKVLGGVITLIVVPFLGFIIKWVFDQNAVIQVLNYRMEQIEIAVDNIDDDMLTKEVLDLKLELIRSDMKALIPDLTGIQEQLDDVERRLLELERGNAGNK